MVNTIQQLAKHFRDVHFGGNWTTVNLKDTLADVSWEEATTTVDGVNSIAVLVFHVNYYVSEVLKALKGFPLTASDKLSFDMLAVNTAQDWQSLKDRALQDAEHFAVEIEKLPEQTLFEDFTDAKYGNYYRNMHGIIEHTHYHLGQISLLKKIIRSRKMLAPGG